MSKYRKGLEDGLNLLNKVSRSLRLYRKSQPSVDMLKGKNDLPSISEFTSFHIDKLGAKQDVKGMFTSDIRTIEIGRDTLEKNKKNAFFVNNIFAQPDKSAQEKGSIQVTISDIRDFSEFQSEFERNKGRTSMLCVGGPAAEDQTVMSAIIDKVRNNLDDIIYVTRKYQESNVNHSAKQSHARHGNALNADSNLTGHKLLPMFLLRNLLGVTVEDTLESDFIKINISNVDFSKLSVYFGNELNWLKQKLRSLDGKTTEHDINRMQSMLSQEIMRAIEEETGVGIVIEKENQENSSIHVLFNEKEKRNLEEENKEFRRVGIEPKKLSINKRDEFFGRNSEVYDAFEYPGDTHMSFDTHERNKQIATKGGAEWIEGDEISQILLTQDEEGDAILAGVATTEGKYIYANKMHFTGGYKVKFKFDQESEIRFQSSFLRNFLNSIEDKIGVQEPLNNETTISTGISINAIFKKSDRLKKLIEKYGSTGEIAVTNSHWTMIAEDKNHIVMRITGGGNTGSEEYNPSYFLNVIANTRRIYGDDLIGILSTYGCPRSINAKNSTEFAKLAQGAIVSYGKGGTGNTKRHSEATLGLILLGFEEEVTNYLDQFLNPKQVPLGKEMKKIYELANEVEFISDNVQKTNRRMGYDDSFSGEELFVIVALLAAASLAIKKVMESEKEDKNEQEDNIHSESGVEPLSATAISKQSSKTI